MAVEESIEYIALERQHDREERDFKASIEQMRQKHEERLAELKIVEEGKLRAKTRRADVAERVIVAVIKLLPVLILVLAIPLLVLAKREVPKFIQDFINL